MTSLETSTVAGPQRSTVSLKIRPWTHQQLEKRISGKARTFDAIIKELLMNEERWQAATGCKTPQEFKSKGGDVVGVQKDT